LHAKADAETNLAALDWLVIKDGAAQGVDFSAGLSYGMALPETTTTLQRDCPTKTRAHCRVIRDQNVQFMWAHVRTCGFIFHISTYSSRLSRHDRWQKLRIEQSDMERLNTD